jgi:hypothetical protein
MGGLLCLTWDAVGFEANVLSFTTNKPGRDVKVPLRPSFRALPWKLRTLAGTVAAGAPIWPEQAAHYRARDSGHSLSGQWWGNPEATDPGAAHRPCGAVPPRSVGLARPSHGQRLQFARRSVEMRELFVVRVGRVELKQSSALLPQAHAAALGREAARNPSSDFHGQTRSDATHESTTDAEVRPPREGQGKDAKVLTGKI